MVNTNALQADDELIAKGQLKVRIRQLPYPATQDLVNNVVELYEQRTALMLADIADILTEDVEPEIKKSVFLTGDGRFIQKAETGAPKAPLAPKAPGSQAASPAGTKPDVSAPRAPGEVRMPGSRGGKFWRDKKGRVQYGEKPTERFTHEAEPHHVVKHFKEYVVSQPFLPHQYAELHEAALESGILDGVDANFMDWFHDNFDIFLDEFGYTEKDLANVDHRPEALTYKLDEEEVSYGEAVEAFFTAYAEDQFLGDKDYGDPEDPEDVLGMIRETMSRYDKALESPEMAELIEKLEEKRQRNFDSFYIQAGEQGDAHENFGKEIAYGSDVSDASFRTSIVMKDLGLLKQAKAGDTVNRKHRGMLILEPSLLSKDKRKLGRLWRKDNKDKLDQLNPGQMMAVYTASRLGDFTDEGSYLPQELSGHDKLDKHDKELFDRIAEGLDAEGPYKDHLFKKLEDTLHTTATDLSEFNNGDSHGADSIMHLDSKDIIGNPSALADHQKKIADHKQFIADVLAAQEDDQLKLPETMHEGPWGAAAKGLSPEEADSHHLKDPDDPSKGVHDMMAYQKQYVNWMMRVKRGILAAGAGLGKTLIAITFLETLRAQGKSTKGLMFLPPSLMEQWPQEIAKFAPDMEDKILNLNGLSLEERKVALQSDMVKNAEYVLISTGTLTGGTDDDVDGDDDGTGGTDDELSDILQKLDGAVFIDEAHQGGYKNKDNTRHKIAKKVMEGREHAFGMTATPVPNSPMDLHTLTDLFHPGSVGSADNWVGRLAQAGWDNDSGEYAFKNPKNVAELNKRARPYVFHKTLEDKDVQRDMGKSLPPKTGVHEDKNMWPNEGDVSMSHTKSANGYSQFDYFKKNGLIDHMVDAHMSKLEEARNKAVESGTQTKAGVELTPYTERHMALMAGAMRTNLHKQASISPELIDPTYQHATQDKGGHSPKIKALVDDVVSHFAAGGHGGESGKGVVVFSSYPKKAFKHVQAALAKRGIDPSLVDTISGEVSATKRGFMQDKLNAGHTKVLLVGTLSGGAGLNLQNHSNATFFLDEPATPAQKTQAQARNHRIGQTDIVKEKTYRTKSTYDGIVESRLAGKQITTDALLGKDMPTDEDFMASAMASVEKLTGRGETEAAGMSAADMRAHLESTHVSDYNIKHQSHVEQQNLMEHALADKHHSGDAKVSYEPSPEDKARLGKRAPHLTKKFDEVSYKKEWDDKRAKRNAKQSYRIANLMHKVYTQKGDHKKASTYRRAITKLVAKHPHLGTAPREKQSRRMQKDE